VEAEAVQDLSSPWSLDRAEARQQRVVLINTTIGALMASLDGSILTVSLPTIARELHTGVALMLWIMMGYTVVITALLLPFGRLADLHGRVRMYGYGFIVFTVSSALCGFAWDARALLIGRMIQGVGSALLWANSTAILTDAFPDRGRGYALGINQVAALTGSVGGLLLGGVITATLGWRWIFFVNLPIGALGAVWTFTALREVATTDQAEGFDTAGMVLFVGGLVLLLLGLTEVIQGTTAAVPWLMAAGAVALAAFVGVERRAVAPLVDLTLLKIRVFLFGNAALFLNALARGALMFLLTFAFQGFNGDSPLVAGLKILPLSFAIIVVGPIAGRMSDRIGSRELSFAGLALSAVALAMLAESGLADYPLLAVGLVLAGVGNGLFNSPNTSAVMGSVPPDRRGVAASARTLLFNTGQLFSMALSFTILAGVMGPGQLAGFLAGLDVDVKQAGHVAFQHGLTEAFLLSAAISAVAAVLALLRGRVGRTPDVRVVHTGQRTEAPPARTAHTMAADAARAVPVCPAERRPPHAPERRRFRLETAERVAACLSVTVETLRQTGGDPAPGLVPDPDAGTSRRPRVRPPLSGAAPCRGMALPSCRPLRGGMLPASRLCLRMRWSPGTPRASGRPGAGEPPETRYASFPSSSGARRLLTAAMTRRRCQAPTRTRATRKPPPAARSASDP
jgi:EmrB/QacA subfamily drug resistance transporter